MSINKEVKKIIKMKNKIHTNTAKFETEDGQIIEIPLPVGENWKEVNTKLQHKLTFVDYASESENGIIVYSPNSKENISINHEEGQVWFKDMSRFLEGSHCVEITEWESDPIFISFATNPKIPSNSLHIERPIKSNWPENGRPRRVLYEKSK